MRLPDILQDHKYLLCISLATISKSETERYGSIMVNRGGVTTGMGCNRAIAHPKFKLERIIRMGYCNHAEIEAMNMGLQNGHDPKENDIFVAGYFPNPHEGFPKPNRLLIKDEPWFTCVRCPPIMKRYGIANIYVPTLRGWQGLTVNEAMESGQQFKDGTHKKRIAAVSTDFTLDQIAKNLIGADQLGIE